MGQQTINNGDTGLQVRTKLNDNFAELYTGKDSVTVNTFADLPDPTTVPQQKYWVLTSTGVFLVNRKSRGCYYSDGAAWIYLGEFPTTADQVGNVPAGTIAATNVQAAIDELDIDKLPTSHAGSGGTAHANAVASGSAGFMTGADKSKLDGVATGATANSSDATLLARANHTGTQTAATISDFSSAADDRVSAGITTHEAAADPHPVYLRQVEGDGLYAPASHVGAGGTAHANVVAAGAAGFMSGADKSKLDGVAAGATANSSDAVLLARANHTGTQAITTILAAATARFFGRITASGGPGEELTGTQATSLLDVFTTTLKGLVPLSGGGTTNFLRADGTWAAPSAGSGSPGGTTGQMQYNAAGAFGGATNAEIENGNIKLVSTTDPVAPAGGLILYSKQVAGRHLPKILGPSGIDTVLQVGLHGNSVFMVGIASGTTAPTAWGGTLTTAATMSLQQTIASANPWQATARKRFATAGTAGSGSGMRTAYVRWFLGNAAGFGGFFFRTQFGQNINLTGAQVFHGLCASTAVLATTAGAVTALLNMIGMGYDTTDANTGNWFVYHNDGAGSAVKVDLGAGAVRNTTHGYDLIIYAPPGSGGTVYVRVINLHTNVVVLDTSYTTDLPAANVGMAYKGEGNNGAVASAINLEVAKVYIESDY